MGKFKETDEAYLVEVSIPQGQEVELNTNLENGVLTISGKVKSSEESVNGNTFGRQSYVSQFSQSITLVKNSGKVVHMETFPAIIVFLI